MIIADPEKLGELEAMGVEQRAVEEEEQLHRGGADETKKNAPCTKRSSRRRKLVGFAYLFLILCLVEAYLARRRIQDLEFLNSLVLNPAHPDAGLDVGHFILNATKSENLFL